MHTSIASPNPVVFSLPYMNTLADRLRLAMTEAGLNQVQLAQAVGVKPPSVNGWLSSKAKYLRGENLLKAARALGVSQEWLATGRGPMRGPDTEAEPGSQSVRIDPDTVRATHELLRGSYADAGKVYDIEAEPDLFAIVYERLANIAAEPQLADLVSIGRAIEQRQQGAIGDKAESDRRASGSHPQQGGKRASG